MDFLIVVIVLLVLFTLITGLRAIIITYKNCIALGSASGFFSDIWKGTGGNIFVILGLLLLCVPVYWILCIRISVKKKDLSYRVQTRYASKECYRKAFDNIKRRLDAGEDIDKVNNEVIEQLVKANEPRKDAEESVPFLILLHQLEKAEDDKQEDD